MEKPRITVVTISFNAIDAIEATILSVINQTYKNVEYIVIDGGSKDGTYDIIKKYSHNLSYHISEPDKGIYDAMNKGIAQATGDYVIFMNAGDSFYNNEAITQISPYLDGNSTIVYGKLMRILNDCKFIGKQERLELLATKDVIPHQATFIKLDYHKSHLFDTSYKSSGDYKFFYDAYFKDHCVFQPVDIIVANYDSEDTGMSRSNIRIGYIEDLRIKGQEYDPFVEKYISRQLFYMKLKKMLPKPIYYAWRRHQLKKHGYIVLKNE